MKKINCILDHVNYYYRDFEDIEICDIFPNLLSAVRYCRKFWKSKIKISRYTSENGQLRLRVMSIKPGNIDCFWIFIL